MELVYLSLTGLSILASILAWIAKIKWSNEYRLAKEAEILALKEQLNILKEKNELIKEFTSDKIMTLYKSTKEGLEILNDSILKEKENLESKVKELEIETDRLKKENKNSIKLPDFTNLTIMSTQIETSLKKFTENYTKQLLDMSNSLEKFRSYDFVIEDDEKTFLIEAKSTKKK